jgi:hypothetical protein
MEGLNEGKAVPWWLWLLGALVVLGMVFVMMSLGSGAW